MRSADVLAMCVSRFATGIVLGKIRIDYSIPTCLFVREYDDEQLGYLLFDT